ncbi:MAG: toll/interleukin-1 receptor domain-containing protein [Clostridia bacterium]|nr:toll/interleukin-1 receptor domain-containing protein [Clostridia bacterium]
MSKNLGITAVGEGIYYFISYNSDDEKRVSQIVKVLEQYSLPMWYDNGLKVGDEWEREIADRIQGSEAVILFLTEGIFKKDSSYVQKEFTMATRFFNKRVYVVLLDKIENANIPNKYLSFYIDLCNMQAIDAANFSDAHSLVSRMMTELGYEPNPEEYIERLKEKYEGLNDDEKLQLAGEFFELWSAKRELAARAKMIAELYLHNSLNTVGDEFSLNGKIGIGLSIYRAETKTCFHTHTGYDAENMYITRDGATVFTVGGRFEPTQLLMYYDSDSDTLFVPFDFVPHEQVRAEVEADRSGRDYIARHAIAIVAIEEASSNPRGSIVEYGLR